jgi:hypothetical protein
MNKKALQNMGKKIKGKDRSNINNKEKNKCLPFSLNGEAPNLNLEAKSRNEAK